MTQRDHSSRGGRGPYNEYLRRGPSRNLSEPELMALKYRSRGLQDKEVAAAMVKSVHTIKSQLKSARKKLDARTTTQAVAEAIRRGIIP